MKNPIAHLRAELARRHLVDFCERVVPDYQKSRHSDYLCGVLQRALSGVGKRKISIQAPPGSGKSTTTQACVAFALGAMPSTRVIALSASAKLSERNSRMIKSFIESPAYPWPDVKISREKDALTDWATTAQSPGRSSFVGFGGEGAVTGHRGDILLVDDLQPDEMTTETRDALESRFRGVMSTRVDTQPLGLTIVIATRWGPDDLIARLQQGDDSDQWEFINLEAICECGPAADPLSRDYGESLWPARWPVEMFAKIKASIGSFNWETQYQGHPVPTGGRIFNMDWFAKRYEADAPSYATTWTPGEISIPPLKLTALDAAQKLTDNGSYSALCTVIVSERRIYVAEVERARVQFDQLLKMVDAHCMRHDSDHLVIEDAAMGSAVITSLRGCRPYNVIDVKPIESKEQRAMKIVPVCERKEVVFPARAHWLGDFEVELRDFPSSARTDMCDAFVWSIFCAYQMYRDRIRAAKEASQFSRFTMAR